MTKLNLRTYPRVDLTKISKWISALSFYSLPLIEISSKKLMQKKSRKELNSEHLKNIINWKKKLGLNDPDELEYKYFLEGIEAIKERSLSPEDLIIPISGNIAIGDLVSSNSSRTKLYYLSCKGSKIMDFWTKKQYHLYEAGLFWLLIRAKKFNPLIQKLISDPRFYSQILSDDYIPSKDGISRSLVKKWLDYFGLLEDNYLNQSKLIILVFYSLVFEMNEQFSKRGTWKEYVADICEFMLNKFSIANGVIEFNVLLDYIYLISDRDVLSGYPTGRGHVGLASKPSIQLLEMKKPLPYSNLETINPFNLRKAIPYGGL